MMNFYLNAQRSFLIGIFLSACLLLGIQMGTAQIIIRDTFLVGGTYTVPAGITEITVQAWGGGGGGGRGNSRSYAAAGGGGGAYAESTITVASGDMFNVVVGLGGQGGTQLTSGSNGTSSNFGSGLVVAPGGQAPLEPSAPYGFISGLGGGPGTGDITFAGGDGDVLVSNTTGGGAGSSAGSSDPGNAANGQIGGAAPADGGKGGDGGSNAQPGLPGLFPGGGGGGKGGGQNVSSGDGADGMIIVSYTIPPVTLDCPGDDGIVACSDQDAVNIAFNAWLDEFGFSGGCETPSGSFDAPTPTAPDACGGSTTVTYRVVSECEDDQVCTHTFTVDAAPLLEVTCPDPLEVPACSTQSAVDLAFAAWLDEFEFNGGCGALESGLTGLTAPSYCGGSIDINYAVSDYCGQTAGCVVTFSVLNPDPIVANCPADFTVDACSSEADINADFSAWLVGFGYQGGCSVSATDLSGLTAPTACGGFVTVTYILSDDCNLSDQCISTFTVEDAPLLSVTCPDPIEISACNSQSDVDAAFAAWLDEFEFNGGCGAVESGLTGLSAPPFCGGSIDVNYEVSDDCNQTAGCVVTFSVLNPDPIVAICPDDFTADACTSQGDVDAAFADWIGQFAVDGGCGATGSSLAGFFAPDICGGSTPVTFTATDNCNQSDQCSATFTVENAPLLTATCPDPVSIASCSSEEDIQTAFELWLTGFDFTGGCLASGSGASLGELTIPSVCGGEETATYVVSDNCNQTDQCSSTFTVQNAPSLIATCPDPETVPLCSTQDEVDAAFTAWIGSFSYEGGCEVVEDGISTLMAPSFCGGSIEVNYEVSDNCGQSDQCSSTFTVEDREELLVTCPSSETIDECTAQQDVDAVFALWLSGFEYEGGCEVTPFDLSGYIAPSFCGGDETITYTISDACGQTETCSSTFSVSEPEVLTVSCPDPVNVDACLTQEEIDEAFYDNFINLFTYSGGCVSETPTFDEEDIFENITRCGGTTVVTYRVTQDCGDDVTCSSTFIVEDAPELSTTCPSDETVNACSDQATVDAAFVTWRNAFLYAGGCDTEVTSVTELTAPDACGGEVSVTYEATDACNQSSSCMSTFSVTPATTLAVTCPENITFDACFDQMEIDVAFAVWIAEFNTVGGCNTISTDISGLLSPLFCGGSETVTYVATDDCFGSSQCVASFIVEEAPELSVTCPTDVTIDACSDQEFIDDAFETWIAGFITVGGCNTISTDLTGYAAPSFCGDVEPVIYTASQDCGPDQTCSSTFTVTEPDELVVLCPDDETIGACMSQEDVNDDFAAWIAQFDVEGGCNPMASFLQIVLGFTGDFDQSVWTFNDNGGDGSHQFIGIDGFELIGSDASDVPMSLTCTTLCMDIPYDGEMSFDWVFSTLDESPEWDPFGYYIGEDFTPIVDYMGGVNQSGSSSIVVSSGDAFCFTIRSTDDFAGRGSVTVSDFVFVREGEPTAPSSCGGSTSVTYTVTSDCDTEVVCTKTFTVNPAPALVVNCPSSVDEDACISESDAQNAFNTWLTGFSVTGGCNAVSNGLENAVLPELCGGSITLNFAASDECGQEGSCSATFTILEAPDVTYSNPSDETVTSCSFADQGEVDNDFASWVIAQTAAINVGGGCDPMITDDSEDQDIPALCEGGSAMVTWTITDDCFTTSVSAVYTLNTLNTVGVSQPSNTSVSSCLYADQSEVEAAFNDWVAEQSANIDPTGGCNPQLTDDSGDVIIPSLCDGGSATVTWSITDLCFSTTVSATFTLTAPSAVTFDAPTGTSSSACDYEDQAAIDAAFADWVAAQNDAFNLVGGCDPQVTDDANSQTIPAFCAGGSATVTWTVSDLCFTTSVMATFTVSPVSGLAFSAIPSTIEYADCSDVPSAVTLTAENSCGNVDVTFDEQTTPGSCAGYYTITRTWTAEDCTGAITATQVVEVSDTESPVLDGELPGGEQPNVKKDDAPLAPSEMTIAALYSDNCSDVVVTLVNSDISGTDCIWTATYTYMVADECGNTASNAVVVYNGVDTQAPVIESCDDVLEVSVVGECFASVDIDTPTFEDNCDATINGLRSDNLDLVDDYPVGITTITWTVEDEGGNTDVCVQTVTVVDAQLINVSGQGLDIENGATIPNVLDGTKFGSVSLSGSITKTFTIENIGCNVLDLTGTPLVSLSGPGASYFSVISQPASNSLAPGASTTFQVKYTGTTYGVHEAIVSISNSDMFNDPYTFAISAATSPAVIRVSGNNITIANGDNTPRTADFTDFGTNSFNSTRTRTFRIHNDGVSTLNLTGTPRVSISGPGAHMFVVSTQPQATVSPGANRLFQVRFTANEVGEFTATVTIESSDLGSNPYTFDIKATVLPPSMQVRGNNIVIDNGDTTPDVSDNTEYGFVAVGSTLSKTFAIHNVGTGHLFLSGTPRVLITGPDASQFVVTAQPVALIAPSSSSIFRISYTPTGMGSHKATVVIYNNDSDNDPYVYDIAGSAAFPIKVGDIFELPGISENAGLTSARLYPNPALDVVYADLPQLGEIYSVDFINLDGKIVHTMQTSGGRVELNISSWTHGMYLMRPNVVGVAPIRFIRSK